MSPTIRPLTADDHEPVVGWSLRVWAAAIEEALRGSGAFEAQHPDRRAAVDVPYQRRGIASALTGHAVRWFTEQGMTTAMVETGGDPGHARARATYERAGFTALPSVRYFRTLP